MDPRNCVQDVVRCTLCTTAEAPMYCGVCHIHLCDECIGKHLADKSKLHNVMSLTQFLSAPKCPDHPAKQCDLHCEQCDVPICSLCISSGKHEQHKKEDILKILASKKDIVRKDLQELETIIYPRYQEAASYIPVQKADQSKHSEELTRDLNKQGKDLHREIETILQKKLSELDDMDAQHLAALDKQEEEIHQKINKIKQVILELKSLLDNSDVYIVSKYKSKNEEFRKLPLKLNVTFPNFQPHAINKEKLLEQFGSLSPLYIETEERDYRLQFPGTEASFIDKPMLDVPRIITNIATGYNNLWGVCCVSDEEIWTRGGYDKIMKLYNLQGELVKSVQTKSGDMPYDFAVTRSGDFVYTDPRDRSINLLTNKKIKTLITLRGWRPLGVCKTFYGDILVIMNSDDYKQTKVVCYSGSTKKQTIQWDDQCKHLYLSGFSKYLSENRNFDICVADGVAGALVVVSAIGKLRFRYTGAPSDIEGSFKPAGIATDSQGHILTSDHWNHRIHIVDQDGHFLRYIDNCGLQYPGGLCVDSRDNLFVAEAGTEKLKKIQYYK